MDFQVTTVLSVFEVVAFTGVQRVAKLVQNAPGTLLSLFLTYLFIQYALLKIYRIIIYPHFLSPLRHLPGPKDNIPLLGQFVALFNAKVPYELPVKWANLWPGQHFIRYLSLLNGELLIMNTPEAHKAVLQTHCYDFQHPDLERRAVGEFVGRGILFAVGAEHRRLRRALLNTLAIPALKRMMPVLQEGCANLTGFLNEEIGEKEGLFVDVGQVFSRATLDLAGVSILGTRLENLKSENPKYNFLTHYRRIMDQGTLSGLITMINTSMPIRKFLPIEANLGYKEACKEIKRMALECVHQRVAEVAENKKLTGENHIEVVSGGRDMLTLMVEERKSFMGTDKEMTDNDISDQLLAFIVGGHETTASSLTWAIYVLVTHPHIQTKLRAELTAFVSQNPSYTYNDVDSIPYLNNFSRELFRTFCAVIATYREATRDITICGTFIPKGTAIHFLPAVMNLSKVMWGEDADKFVPERWDKLVGGGGGGEGGETMDPYAYMAFSHGPRTCPGKHYGTLNFKLMLIELLRHFRFGASPEIEKLGGRLMAMQNPSPSLRPSGGLRVWVERL